MNTEPVINITEVKKHADRIMNLEVQKRDIDEEVKEIMKKAGKLG